MILADIYIPALNEQYDFKLNENAYIADVLRELGNIFVSPLDPGAEEARQDLLLCSYEGGRILALDRTLKQEGFGNGSRLILI